MLKELNAAFENPLMKSTIVGGLSNISRVQHFKTSTIISIRACKFRAFERIYLIDSIGWPTSPPMSDTRAGCSYWRFSGECYLISLTPSESLVIMKSQGCVWTSSA